MNYELNMAPNWLYEAAVLLSEQNSQRTDKLLNNHSSFGLSKEEMSERLSKFVQYKEVVLPKILPIFEEYPFLDKYFKDARLSPESDLPAAPTIATRLENDGNKIPSKDKIDVLVNDFIVDIISGFDERIDDNEIIINSLEDLLKYLDIEKVTDETKLLLIDLYYNRYRIIEGLLELLQRCILICKEYFHIIEDDFLKTMELVSDRDNVMKLLEMDSSLKINLHEGSHAFVSISNFNGLHVTVGPDGFVMYIGIYFFDYLKLKTENRFNDTQIINDLKALGDATRLKIVHMLAKQKMYVQELSNELKLTPATVSHHINVLLKSELITITLDTEKPKTIYYELNKSKIDSLGSTIQSLANYKEV